MNKTIIMEKTIEIHPDWYYPILEMKTLILGTYPPSESKRHFEFYYPNRINRFWKIMAKVADSHLNSHTGEAAVLERQALMKTLKVGVQNLGLKIERKDNSASDDMIKILEFQDILGLVKTATSLKCILLTGYSGKTSTYKDFIKYLKMHQVEHSVPIVVKAGEKFNIIVEGRDIVVYIGNSTSTAARRVTEKMLVKQFSDAIFQK